MINIFMIIQVCHVPELQVFILFYLFFLTSENDINLNSPRELSQLNYKTLDIIIIITIIWT